MRLVVAISAALALAGAAVSFEETFRQGLLALEAGRLPEAQRLLAQAVQLRPRDARAQLALAQAARRAGDRPTAARAIDATTRLAPKDPRLAAAIALYFAESEAWLPASEWALRAGQSVDAEAFARNALTRQKSPEAFLRLGEAARARGDFSTAAEAFAEAVQLAPADARAHFLAAQALLESGRFAAARDRLLDSRRRFPNDAQLALALGVAHYSLRQFPAAIEQLLAVIALDATVPQPYPFLATMLDQAGDQLPDILTRFREAARRAPSDKEASLRLAQALTAQDPASPEAEQRLLALTQSAPAMPVPHLELGRIYERTRRWPQAAASLQRAAQLAPKDPRPHFHLARVWERQNQPERAAAARRRHKELAEAEEAEAAKQLGPRQTMR